VTALPLAFEVKWDSFVQYYRFNMEAFVIDIRFIHGKMFIITASPLAVDVIAILFSFVTRDIYEEKFFLAYKKSILPVTTVTSQLSGYKKCDRYFFLLSYMEERIFTAI